MTKTRKPMRPTIKGERTWADNHGYGIPPHVSAITTDVVEAITRTFPLRAKVRLEAHKFTNAYMMSIFLTFSFRVAGGVLRRRKSTKRIMLKAHIGILRSVGQSRESRHESHHQSKAAHKTTTSWMGKR